MKLTDLTIIAILTCAVAPFTAAAQTVQELATNAPSAGDYPDATGVILVREESVAPAESGGVRRSVRSVAKILTAAGRDDFSDSRITANETYTQILAATGRSLTPDGQLKEVEEDAINTVTPPWLSDPGRFAGIRDRVFSFAASGPDVLTELDYTTVTRFPEAQSCAGTVSFQNWKPVVTSRFTITLPAAAALRYQMFNGAVEPARTSRGDLVSYTFELSNLAAIKQEDLSPSLQELSPRLVYSAYSSWKDAAGAFRQRFSAAAKPTAAIKAKARELSADISGPDRAPRIVDRLAAFVSGEIRAVSVPLDLTGYAPHAADETLRHGSGSELDKAVLFASLLAARGIDAWPVLANSARLPLALDVPALQQFDTVLVAAVIDKELAFIAFPANETLVGYVPNCSNSQGLSLRKKHPEFVTITSRKGTESRAATNIDLEIAANGDAAGRISVKLTGDFDQQARASLGDLSEQQRKMELDSALSQLSPDAQSTQRTLSNAHDLLTPMTLSDDITIPGFAVLQNGILLVELPEIPYGAARLRAAPRLESRENPLQISSESEEWLIVRVSLPEGFEPMYVPKGFSYEDEYGSFAVEVQREQSAREIRVIRSKVFTQRTVPLANYEKYREQMSIMDKLANRLIMLRRTSAE